MAKIQQKRTKPIDKAWYILKPFFVYTIAKTFVQLTVSMLISAVPLKSVAVWIANNSLLLNAVINGIAALIGVFFVLSDFLKEVTLTGEINIDQGVIKQFFSWAKQSVKQNKDKAIELAGVISLGVTSALGLNIVIELLAISSEKYQDVEAIQYSVPLWLGLILYGIIAPITEEIVFRGITYNRMKRYFGVVPCIVMTAMLFGGFHANLPQFLYGTCMGVLMALSYEWVKSFAAPVLFHVAANCIVFMLSFVKVDIVHWLIGAFFLGLAGGLIVFLFYRKK